jgi:thiol-disulfide isomerase/thioredoxin
MRLWWTIALVMLTSCASSLRTDGIVAAQCGTTAVVESDMQVFGFHPEPGKVVVMRVFATWCPFCKADLMRIGEMFKSGKWQAEHVEVYLLAYQNHDESQASFAQFVSEDLEKFGLPRSAVQIHYVDLPHNQLASKRSASGQVLFEGWKGVPFGLVFGTDQRLAFRGHFTMSDGFQENHYRFISDLQRESCTPRLQ